MNSNRLGAAIPPERGLLEELVQILCRSVAYASSFISGLRLPKPSHHILTLPFFDLYDSCGTLLEFLPILLPLGHIGRPLPDHTRRA